MIDPPIAAQATAAAVQPLQQQQQQLIFVLQTQVVSCSFVSLRAYLLHPP